jgi:hypothetical protein
MSCIISATGASARGSPFTAPGRSCDRAFVVLARKPDMVSSELGPFLKKATQTQSGNEPMLTEHGGSVGASEVSSELDPNCPACTRHQRRKHALRVLTGCYHRDMGNLRVGECGIAARGATSSEQHGKLPDVLPIQADAGGEF